MVPPTAVYTPWSSVYSDFCSFPGALNDRLNKGIRPTGAYNLLLSTTEILDPSVGTGRTCYTWPTCIIVGT